MKLENKFDVPTPPDRAWEVLMDVPSIVGCVPGAELVSAESDTTYKGRVSVKLGPVALKFNGTASIEDADPETHTATIRANGADQQGRGSAGALTTMLIEPSATGSTVTLNTDLQLSGLVAQYGRASGVINAVANTIISKFAENLRAQMTGAEEASPAAAEPGIAVEDVARTAPGPEPKKDNAMGGGMVWRIFVAWLGGLFGRGKRS